MLLPPQSLHLLPTSSLLGARFCMLASSVLCGLVGRFTMLISPRALRAGPAAPAAPAPAAAPAPPCTKRGKRKLARDSAPEAEDKSPIKSITASLVADNLAYFSWRHMCRKIIPPVHRNLTMNYKSPGYVLRSDFRTLSRVWRLLTEDLRRPYMQDQDTASRTWYGVFVTSTAFPGWIKSIAGMAHMRAVGLAQPSNGRMIVPLHRAMLSVFSCLYHTPVSFHSQIEALYVFTTQKTLDLNTMILSCYAMHVLGLQQNCPLHVLALVVQGVVLTREQQRRYDAFSEFLIPLVTGQSPGLLHQGYFKQVSVDNVLDFCEYADTSSHMMIRDLWMKRNQVVLTTVPSVFLRPSVDVVVHTVPEEIRACTEVRKGNAGAYKFVVDPFVCATGDDMIAHMWAQQQTEQGEADRLLKQIEKKIKPWHRLADWWNHAAVPGTRMPGQQRKITSDKYNIEFEPPFETGHYFTESLRNLGSAKGVTRHMLMMCGMAEDSSRHEFVTALLKPYMTKHGIVSAVPTEHEWKSKILDCTESCFRFGCMLYMKTEMHNPSGVETVLGMDVLWLIIAQGLYANEWAIDAPGCYTTVVHQRNMGGQAKALLVLMLHTQLDKSSVPPLDADGCVAVGSQSGELSQHLKSETAARIFFDHRLSTDLYLLDDTLDVRNILNMRMRAAKQLCFIDLAASKTRALYYRAVLEAGESSFRPDCLGLLPPFPPESTQHMQTHWGFCKQAY